MPWHDGRSSYVCLWNCSSGQLCDHLLSRPSVELGQSWKNSGALHMESIQGIWRCVFFLVPVGTCFCLGNHHHYVAYSHICLHVSCRLFPYAIFSWFSHKSSLYVYIYIYNNMNTHIYIYIAKSQSQFFQVYIHIISSLITMKSTSWLFKAIPGRAQVVPRSVSRRKQPGTRRCGSDGWWWRRSHLMGLNCGKANEKQFING